MKKAGTIIVALLCIGLVCTGFYFLKKWSDESQNIETELTEVQKIVTKDLSKDYPKTPREVVKLYNRIITCYYGEEYTDEELEQLADQALQLFDSQLRAENPREEYLLSVRAEIETFESLSKYIAQSNVEDSNSVLYKTIDGDEIAYVMASYFIREGNSYTKTYQEYVLRKDGDGNWKILTFYQSDKVPSEEE